jgi:thiosulfate/3-mercaptopyruvate sulfurtransferase
MAYARPDALVDSAWLAAHLGDPSLKIVDGSFKLPGVVPTARADYEQAHIPAAGFFDIDDIAMPGTDLPHMLPSAQLFAEKMSLLGIGDGDRVVVYDGAGLSSAGRAWWMLRLFGHPEVAILDGGLPKWRAEGRPLTSALPPPRRTRFTARFEPGLVRDKAALLTNLASGGREQVVDARAAERFAGAVPELRPGLRRGHIPKSRNLPYERLTDSTTRQLRTADELRALFVAVGVDLGRPIVTSCGSGVTACALAFALHLVGHEGAAVYDGSWSEWGRPGDTPVEIGPAPAG